MARAAEHALPRLVVAFRSTESMVPSDLRASSLTRAALVTVVGQWRLLFVASLLSTLAASATVVALVGWQRLPLATSSS